MLLNNIYIQFTLILMPTCLLLLLSSVIAKKASLRYLIIWLNFCLLCMQAMVLREKSSYPPSIQSKMRSIRNHATIKAQRLLQSMLASAARYSPVDMFDIRKFCKYAGCRLLDGAATKPKPHPITNVTQKPTTFHHSQETSGAKAHKLALTRMPVISPMITPLPFVRCVSSPKANTASIEPFAIDPIWLIASRTVLAISPTKKDMTRVIIPQTAVIPREHHNLVFSFQSITG